MDINLRLLRTFMLVAEHSSFRDASEQVHRSQSAVSAQVKQLEQQLGVALFHRTTRRVQLTAAGETLRGAAERGMRELAHGLREIQETLDLRSGRVSLASSPILAATRLPHILAVFEQHYPAVRVLVQELTPADLYASVSRADVDFGIGPALQAPEFDVEPIFSEEIHAMVPRHLRDSTADSIAFKDLARIPVLLLSNATALRTLLDEAAKRCGIVLSPKYECTQPQTLIAMASAGLGAAILPQSVMPRKAHASVRIQRITAPVLSRKMGLITVRGRTLSPAAARLAQLVRERIDGDRPAATRSRRA